MKEHLITLITEDIKNTHLINGLQKLGIDADIYTSKTTDVIFSLMKIDETKNLEEIHKQYFDLMKWSVQKGDAPDFDGVAEVLYAFLEDYCD